MDKHTDLSELKNFIYILSGILFTLAIYPLFRSEAVRYWMLFLIIFLLITVTVKPQWLKPFYLKWIAVGDLIGNIVSKAVLLILFFCFFTPVSFVLKLLKKDPLHKKMDSDSQTYWTKRESPPESMKNQF